MKRPHFFRSAGFFAVMALSPVTLPAQALPDDPVVDADPGNTKTAVPDVDLSDPERLAKAADEAVLRGEWLKAAANYNGLQTIGRKVGVAAKDLEPLQFFIGFSMFNVPNYGEALQRFQEYEKLYPAGPQIDQARLGIARCFRAQKRWADAISYYKPLSDKSAMGEEVLVELAEAYTQNWQKPEAIALLEARLAGGLKNTATVRAALYLAGLYDAEPLKGLAWLENVKKAPDGPSFAPEIGFTSMNLADALMQLNRHEDALRTYQNLRRKNEVLTILNSRVTDCDQELVRLSDPKAAKGPRSVPYVQELVRTKSFHADAKRMIKALEKEADYDAIIGYRTGRCLTALQRYAKASEAFREVYQNFPAYKDRRNVLYALAFCAYNMVPENPAKDQLTLVEDADELLKDFLRQWKDAPEAGTVAEMRVNLATRLHDSARLEKVMKEVKGQLPQ